MEKTITQQYHQLSQWYTKVKIETINTLDSLIERDGKRMEGYSGRFIKVYLLNYVALGKIDGKLTFIDNDGLHYGLFDRSDLSGLIYIIGQYINT